MVVADYHLLSIDGRDAVIQYIVFLIVAFSLLVTGCATLDRGSSAGSSANALVEIENYNTQGKPVKVKFRQEPQRVIAVWQNSVETLLALGLQDRLVAALGVPYPECIKKEYRQAYESIPLRQPYVLDTENMLMLEPDFILAWASTFTDRYTRSTEFWNGRGVQTYMARSSMRGTGPQRIADEYQYILDIGRIFGKERLAQVIVKQMDQKIHFVQETTKGRTRPRALILEVIKDQIMVYGKDTLAGDILMHVCGELIDTGRTISYEQIIEENPDVIFLVVSENKYASADLEARTFMEKAALQSVAAVQNKRIYVTPLFMVYSSAVRTYDGICLMARGLYPDLKEEDSAVEENKE